MEETKALPLLVLAESGAVVDVAWMNRKGFSKSRENGILWSLHESTGRLLPYAGNTPFVRLLDCGRWYQAVVSPEAAVDLASAGIAPGDGSSTEAKEPGREGGAQDTAAGDALHALMAVIERRKRELPEGSYTTYLFTAGLDKIRKKTGEEAMEVILAQKHEHIVSESADLIYHLFVLLAAQGVALDEVLGELAGRAK